MTPERTTYLDKLNRIHIQTRQMMDPHGSHVRCGCGRTLQPVYAYRCLYCGEWYCRPCAEIHFGKTVAEYRQENPLPDGITDARGQPFAEPGSTRL